jgi:predicted XRE-type DNA-binding protein
MKTQKFASVWDALEDSPEMAASMKARSSLMMSLVKVIEGWKLTQADAAKRLGITQPRLNDLLRGRIEKFSLDALFDLSTRAQCQVQVKLLKKAA